MDQWELAQEVNGLWKKLLMEKAALSRLEEAAKLRKEDLGSGWDEKCEALADAIEQPMLDFPNQVNLLETFRQLITGFLKNSETAEDYQTNYVLMGNATSSSAAYTTPPPKRPMRLKGDDGGDRPKSTLVAKLLKHRGSSVDAWGKGSDEEFLAGPATFLAMVRYLRDNTTYPRHHDSIRNLRTFLSWNKTNLLPGGLVCNEMDDGTVVAPRSRPGGRGGTAAAVRPRGQPHSAGRRTLDSPFPRILQPRQ